MASVEDLAWTLYLTGGIGPAANEDDMALPALPAVRFTALALRLILIRFDYIKKHKKADGLSSAFLA